QPHRYLHSFPTRRSSDLYRDNWNIQLTKTGFTNAAGHCLVMRTVFNGKPVALVVMDAFGKYTHFADASRLRTWIETGKVQPVPRSEEHTSELQSRENLVC